GIAWVPKEAASKCTATRASRLCPLLYRAPFDAIGPATLRGHPSGQNVQSPLLGSKGMSSGGLATTHQCTMATLCGTLHKHEVGPDGHAWGLRDSPRSTAWTERVRDARIAHITPSSGCFHAWREPLY